MREENEENEEGGREGGFPAGMQGNQFSGLRPPSGLPITVLNVCACMKCLFICFTVHSCERAQSRYRKEKMSMFMAGGWRKYGA